MNINKLIFRNFKTLEDVSFEPGRVNVFIGANGSGKTTILEAIGLLCAAMTDRVDNASMQRKGVRLSVPGLYKSAFSDLKRKAPTINFDVSWSQNEKNYQYGENPEWCEMVEQPQEDGDEMESGFLFGSFFVPFSGVIRMGI